MMLALDLTITPGFDCALRLFTESPGGFHLLGKFDSHADAKAARQAAESVPAMLAAIFNPIPASNHDEQTAADLRARFSGE